MKLIQSLLLGSAAALVALSAANAADLPSKKSAPVEYVKICNAYGVGYFYIPGTDTCLRIGGRVRAEYGYLNAQNAITPTFATGALTGTSSKGVDQSGIRARGRIQTDARTQTAYGTLRTFVRFEITAKSGVYDTGANGGTSTSVDKAFIQFAGVTAGKAQSMFDFYADALQWEAIRNSDASNLMLAYTATFGGGFSATLAVEDRKVRDAGIYGTNTIAPVTVGEQIPDVVGNVRVDQSWGSAQLSGVAHQIKAISSASNLAAVTTSTYGYAVQGGVQIKLPMLAAGDELWLEGAYANGALDYLGIGPNNGFLGGSTGGGFQRSYGGVIRKDGDAIAVAQTATGAYTLEKEKGFSVMAALQHYWVPSVRSVFFGSYAKITTGGLTKSISWTNGGLGNASEYRIGTDLVWSPVKDFDIGIELLYSRLNQTLAGTGTIAVPTLNGVVVKTNPSAFEARLRLQRDF